MNTGKPESEAPVQYVGHDHVGAEAICVDNVSYRYEDGTLALEDISLHVAAGSTLAVVGPNGAGKTTLLKVILGLLRGYTGSVRLHEMTPEEARRRGNVVSWVPQRQNPNWDLPVSVRQVVRMGLVGKTGLFRRYRRDDLDYVEHVITVMDLRAIADRPIGELSGGQQQRAVVARALAPRPGILMLDEPTIGVDQPGQALFAELTDAIKREFSVTLVIVSHDLGKALATCQRIACLNRTLHFHDVPQRLTNDVLSHVFKHAVEGLAAAGQQRAPQAKPSREP